MSVVHTLGLPLLVFGLSVLLTVRASGTRASAVFAPLTTAFAALYALTGVESLADKRGLLIVLGLGVAALGTALRRRLPWAAPLGLMVMGTCLLGAVITGVSRAGLLGFLAPVVLVFVIIAIVYRRLLLARGWLFLSGGLLVLLVQQAGERWLEFGTSGTLLALLGTVLLALAALLWLSGGKHIQQGRDRDYPVCLLFYYAAQWCWALSVLLRYYDLDWFV